MWTQLTNISDLPAVGVLAAPPFSSEAVVLFVLITVGAVIIVVTWLIPWTATADATQVGPFLLYPLFHSVLKTDHTCIQDYWHHSKTNSTHPIPSDPVLTSHHAHIYRTSVIAQTQPFYPLLHLLLTIHHTYTGLQTAHKPDSSYPNLAVLGPDNRQCTYTGLLTLLKPDPLYSTPCSMCSWQPTMYTFWHSSSLAWPFMFYSLRHLVTDNNTHVHDLWQPSRLTLHICFPVALGPDHHAHTWLLTLLKLDLLYSNPWCTWSWQ